MSHKRNKKRQSILRKIIRIRDNFTCQDKSCENPNPCPVVDQCYQTAPNDPRIIGVCSFVVSDPSMDVENDKWQGYRKIRCPLQVHHKRHYKDIREENLTANEEAAICELLCENCHTSLHH